MSLDRYLTNRDEQNARWEEETWAMIRATTHKARWAERYDWECQRRATAQIKAVPIGKMDDEWLATLLGRDSVPLW